VSALDELSEEALLEILLRPKNALVKQYKKFFEIEGVELTFSDDALRRVVQLTQKRGTGARGLRSILEDAMLDIMYEVPSRSGIKECIITPKVIDRQGDPKYIFEEPAKKRA
jgi:ATP-dependent Clp protease ATP-binding subunit ClpX